VGIISNFILFGTSIVMIVWISSSVNANLGGGGGSAEEDASNTNSEE
jgi:hypothetical protein